MTHVDAAGRRVVIVTPGQLGSNPRVVKEAQALHQAGLEVTVIAAKVAEFVEERDQSVIGAAPYRVLRVSFEGRTRRVADRLRMEVARAHFRLNGAPRAATFASSAMTSRLAAAASSVPADLYIAHYVAALPAAAMAARRHGGQYAFDAEDFHLGDLPDRPEHDFEKSLIFAIESQWLPGAAFVTAAAPLIADAYVERYGIARPKVVLNVFPRSHARPAPTLAGTARPGPSVYWFSQTIGPGRGLEAAVAAVARAASRPHLYLRGTPAAGYRNRLLILAQQLGVEERLHFLEPVPPPELEMAGAAYDIGYVGETGETTNRSIALTNKNFSYLTSGLPIIATDTPAHTALAPSLDGIMSLFSINAADQLACQFDAFLLNADRLAEARRRSWSMGQTAFSWEAQAPTIVGIAEVALQSRGEHRAA